MRHPECVEDLSRNIWYRGWSEDMDIAKDVSLALLGRRAGLSEDEAVDCVEAMETEEVKALLKATTEEAVREGAYGLPYLVFHKRRNEGVETFFGSDRFELIANVMGKAVAVSTRLQRPDWCTKLIYLCSYSVIMFSGSSRSANFHDRALQGIVVSPPLAPLHTTSVAAMGSPEVESI